MGASESDIGWRASTVLHRYCHAIDHHDADALKAVFSDDVVLLVGGETNEGGDGSQQSFAGRDTVVQILASLFEQRQWARHLVSNVLVHVGSDGDVDVRSSFQYLLAKQSERTIGIGDYHVTMRDVDGQLLITTFSAAILDEVTVSR
jgi:ketosteroid isomerase-like protein